MRGCIARFQLEMQLGSGLYLWHCSFSKRCPQRGSALRTITAAIQTSNRGGEASTSAAAQRPASGRILHPRGRRLPPPQYDMEPAPPAPLQEDLTAPLLQDGSLPLYASQDPAALQQQQQQLHWDYKFAHTPCTSPCDPNDLRALKMEALFQVVLGYPRLPPRVHRYLNRIDHDVDGMTRTVELMADHFGREPTLYFVQQMPYVLEHDFEAITSRVEHARSMLDLRPADMLLLLRKNPLIMCMEPVVVKERFDALHHSTMLNHEGVRALVLKMPLVLKYTSEYVQDAIDDLRQLASEREIWQWSFERMTPSLLAFYLKDKADLLMRLEFLLYSGHGHSKQLRDVFKPSNNLFLVKYSREYWPWRKGHERCLSQLQQQQQQQQHDGIDDRVHEGGGSGSGSGSAPLAPDKEEQPSTDVACGGTSSTRSGAEASSQITNTELQRYFKQQRAAQHEGRSRFFRERAKQLPLQRPWRGPDQQPVGWQPQENAEQVALSYRTATTPKYQGQHQDRVGVQPKLRRQQRLDQQVQEAQQQQEQQSQNGNVQQSTQQQLLPQKQQQGRQDQQTQHEPKGQGYQLHEAWQVQGSSHWQQPVPGGDQAERSLQQQQAQQQQQQRQGQWDSQNLQSNEKPACQVSFMPEAVPGAAWKVLPGSQPPAVLIGPPTGSKASSNWQLRPSERWQQQRLVQQPDPGHRSAEGPTWLSKAVMYTTASKTEARVEPDLTSRLEAVWGKGDQSKDSC